MTTIINNNAEGGSAHTTAPVTASPANDVEFVDAPGLQARFGIKRSLAYTLMADGAIRGVSLRRRGQLKGKRLFDVASVRAFLNARCAQDDIGAAIEKSIASRTEVVK
jgi:hypothetical protein